MKKILFILIAILSFCLANDKASTSLQTLVNQIENTTLQISILKAQADSNSTADTKTGISLLESKKSKMLQEIPNYIMQQSIADTEINTYKNAIQKAELSLKSQTTKQSNASAKIKLLQNKFDLYFYSAIYELGKMFNQDKKEPDIKKYIENTLINLQTASYDDLLDIKSIITNNEILETEYSKLITSKSNYEDILQYLKQNASILSSNLILSNLNLKTMLDKINSYMPYAQNIGINIGKVTVIAIVFIFLISFTHIVSKITFWLFVSIIAKKLHGENYKEQFIKIIKKPISAILIVYAIDVCFSIAYYPAPILPSISNTLGVIYIIALCWLTIVILNSYGILIINEITKKSGRKEVINLILKIIYFIIIVLTALMILARLGFDISALIASLGIGGLAVAFAAKDIIANFFASIMLLFDNTFSQGDTIVCGDIQGTVVEIGLRKTTLRSFDNSLIFVPNSTLTGSSIINWTRRKVGRNIKMSIGLTYDSDPKMLLKTTNEIRQMLQSHPDISRPDNGGSFEGKGSRLQYKQHIVSINDLAGYKSDILVNLEALDDSSINILVYCFTKTIKWDEWLKVREDVIFRIMDIVYKNGLSFAFPSQSVYFENKLKTENKKIEQKDDTDV